MEDEDDELQDNGIMENDYGDDDIDGDEMEMTGE